ncbi:thrombomodulin [Megalobrama amblycephala]|uniref:thrombomodulin n=1 Tax=Megalobrama amblycephala TaxID=75352 RepID=UPI0020144B3C|nr:thrombomodulin [Megalobrama amblycephala]
MREILGMALALVVLRVHGENISEGFCVEGKCFVVQTNSATFDEAQKVCREKRGHLMTVRTQKSADVLSKLLKGTSGNFWLGLRYQCSNDGLKGYKWVTGDDTSLYINWESDRAICFPQCASVSQKVQKLAERPCDERIEGYLCEYDNVGYCKPLSNDADVLYEIPFGFKANELQEIPQGTNATLPPLRTRHVCFDGFWIQAPWTCEVFGGGCDYKCRLNGKNYECLCQPGFKLDSNKVTCSKEEHEPAFKVADLKSSEDCKPGYRNESGVCVDEDECESAPCEHDCINTEGGYQCKCNEGFIQSTKEPDKCKMHCTQPQCPAECDPNNEDQCNCPDGFLLEGTDEKICVDIDECDNNECDQTCENIPGGFVCSCNEGFELLGESKCVKEDFEGSGSSTPFDFFTPTSTPPTDKPMSISAGSLLAIMVAIVVCILVLVCLAHCILRRFCQMHNYDVHKGHENIYDFQQVIIEKNCTEQSFPNRYLKRDT